MLHGGGQINPNIVNIDTNVGIGIVSILYFNLIVPLGYLTKSYMGTLYSYLQLILSGDYG